jgi:hypothetical protein
MYSAERMAFTGRFMAALRGASRAIWIDRRGAIMKTRQLTAAPVMRKRIANPLRCLLCLAGLGSSEKRDRDGTMPGDST